MDYRSLGTAGLKVSPICLGTMMFGGTTPAAESIEIMHQALDLGVNFFDTANFYQEGESEVVVGRALADRRDQVVLATKGGIPVGTGPNDGGSGRRHLTRALDDSLRRLKTDHVDLYYVHRFDATTPLEETLRALDDFISAGKTRYIACSNFRAWQLLEALWISDRHGWSRFACLQPLYNICNRDVEIELLPACQRFGLGVVCYSPLARGVLSGKYRVGEPFPEGSRAARNDKRMQETELRDDNLRIAETLQAHAEGKGTTLSRFALAWVLANPIISSVIVGPRTRAQFEDNMQCLQLAIDAEDEAVVDALVPPGAHSGYDFQDPAYPIAGRPSRL